MPQSELQQRPKSRILERGYLNVYSELTSPERRQLAFKRRLKQERPGWDDSTIRACQRFADFLSARRERGLTSDPVVLDAGCGRGNYVVDEFRAQIGWAVGVDLDPAATSGNVSLDEVRYAPLDAIPYPDETFDAVIALWVFEHLERPEPVFRELARVLKPGGLLLFLTPNARCWLVWLKRLLQRRAALRLNRQLYGREADDVFPTYYRANDVGGLRHLLTDAGFGQLELTLNFDPSYTSFDAATFWLSKTLDRALSFVPSFSRMHIVGSGRRR